MTTHRPDKMSFPGTMTNLQSGTWMLGGEDVMKDGVRLSDKPYTKHDAESLKVGIQIYLFIYLFILGWIAHWRCEKNEREFAFHRRRSRSGIGRSQSST